MNTVNMKHLFAFLITFFCLYINGSANEHPGQEEKQSDLEARIQQLQNVNRDLTVNGIKIQALLSEGIKYIRLEDIFLENVQFEVKRPTVRMEINVANDATATLPKLSVSGWTVDLLNSRILMDLKAPEVLVQGDYSVSGHVKSFTPVAAENPFTMKSKGLKISAVVKVSMNEEILVENIEFSVSLLKSKGQFGNIEGVDVVLKSAVAKAISEDLMKAISPQIQNKVKEKLAKMLQKSLRGVSHCSLAGCQLPETTHPTYVKEQTQNINAIIDEVLVLVSNIMKDEGFDPMALPDIGIEWGFSIFKLKVGLFDGFAEGISNLARADDWTLHINGLTKYSIDGSIAVFTMGGQYTWIAKYMGIGAEADFRADISYLDITINFSLDILNCSISMDTFEIGDVGHVDITVDGFFIFDWFVETVTEFFTNVLLGVVTNIVEYIVQDIINDIIESFNICDKLLPSIIVGCQSTADELHCV